MMLSKDGVARVTEEYKNIILVERLSLNVGNPGYGSDSVYNGNWQVCRLDELSAMITELTIMKEAIKKCTGCVL